MKKVKKKQYNFKIVSFYRFVPIDNKKKFKEFLDQQLKNKKIKGTILLSYEGINGSISGCEQEIEEIIKFIKKLLNIRKINKKSNNSNFIPFNRMKVRLKKEIVSLGVKNNIKKFKSNLVHPSKWNQIIKKKNIKILDVRNKYEIEIGRFKNSINPSTENFRKLPLQFENLNIKKNETIAMYCTGGIRCEKAGMYLREKGYKRILQLEGGILNYLDYFKNKLNKNKWNGECFVFDNRVTVNKKLKPGKYIQCYGCRQPISFKDTKSPKYQKGVCCPYCFDSKTEKQKKNLLTRQKQIYFAEKKGINHPFKKIISF